MDYFAWDLEESTPAAPEGLAERLAAGFGQTTLEGRDPDTGDLWEEAA